MPIRAASASPKVAKLVANDALREYVQDRLAGAVVDGDGRAAGPAGPTWKGRSKPHRKDRRWVQGWSPEQISQRLRVDFPDNEAMRISHEANALGVTVAQHAELKPSA